MRNVIAIRPPWNAFLADLDAAFNAPFELHCLGGFVIAQLHDFARVTVDVDIIEVRGAEARAVGAIAAKAVAFTGDITYMWIS